MNTDLTWTVRMWEKRPREIAIVLVGCALAGLLGVVVLQGLLGGLLGFGLVAASTTDFWLPQKFRLDATGASLRCGISVTSIEWSAVKRVYEVSGGVKLTPLEQDGRLEPFRGVLLRYAGNREDVLDTIGQFWSGDVRSLEG